MRTIEMIEMGLATLCIVTSFAMVVLCLLEWGI